MLPTNIFKVIIENTPLVAIDIIAYNCNNQILLGKRTNRPAKDTWFVPGGRIFKNESLDNAFLRIAKNELNISLDRNNAIFTGNFEHFYNDSAIDPHISTHYIMLVYQVKLDEDQIIELPLDQHSKFEWFSKKELIANHEVHPNTKRYFENTSGI